MPELIAQGTDPDYRWRRQLSPGVAFTLGRHAASWSIPWDDRISRRHVQARWQDGRLEVVKLPEARNPVYFRGRQTERCWLRPGEHFVIGQTTFTLTDAKVQVSAQEPPPFSEQTYSADYLQGLRFRHADQRIDALSRLPRLILSAGSDSELCVRLVNALLSGIPRARSVAIVVSAAVDSRGQQMDVLHWDRRPPSDEDFSPSGRLIREAVDRQVSRLHVWRKSGGEHAFTQAENMDWAFCTPVPGDACRGWALYVSGRFADDDPSGAAADPQSLQDDLKFAEVAAATLGNLRSLRLLERRQVSLGQFFSPLVLETLAGQDPERVLAPREADVSVLFCDLRGFSQQSEQAGDHLLELLNRVSDALGVMTHHILLEGGVVGDFHGDSAMGFWGWPLEQSDAAQRACRAALGIRASFAQAAGHDGRRLAGFRIGIGIASGRAVAGKIGTVDQVKVTVFGPVVNLASRLEAMTKHLRAPILIDRATAKSLREAAELPWARVRRVAKVLPYGLQSGVEVSELLPPEHEYPQLQDHHLQAYEAALDALQAGDWPAAFELLHQVPAEDRVKDFLTVFIAQHNRTAPPDWKGFIPLSSK
ncbi:MAG: adenylate/guanylate cyclase domain-containing protein [Pirellulaceae bacterium]|nr:adenylate/guanylate cyclase domain-containing protein [Pirellulaceae bacterium]